MTRPEYTEVELQVMQGTAHGLTRPQLSEKLGISVSTVGRVMRDATDKAVSLEAPIMQGIATMVAEGSISVPFKGQKSTAHETALHWLHTRMMSELNADELVQLRTAYRAMVKEQSNG